MAKDIVFRLDGGSSRTDLYCILTNGDHAINHSTGASEALSSGSWTDYAIPLSDTGTTAIYSANVPADTPQGYWTPICFIKLGGSPAESDTNIAIGDALPWDGTKVLTLLSIYGTGDTPVDANSGGALNLAYQYMGVGIAGAVVRAFLQSDFSAGNYVIRGSTITVSPDGTWANPLWLQSGNTYTITYSLPSMFLESSKTISI